MKISVEIEATFNNTPPIVRIFTFGNAVEHKLCKGNNILNLDLKVLKEDLISIEFTNKDDVDDNIIELKNLLLDGINLQHFIFEGTFVPVYNMNWYNSLEHKPPSSYQPGTLMRHNGVWSLPIKSPIWKMVMEKWIDDERSVA